MSALPDHDVDVAVIGGGPAGSAAALTLLRYTHRRVALVERTAFESPRVGESVSSAIAPLLGFLGADEAASDTTAHAACMSAAAWGGPEPVARHSIFTAQGGGLLLDRRAFDAALGRAVADRGGSLLLGHRLRQARREQDGWQLELLGPAGAATLRCRFVIDASGRSSCFATAQGARRHRMDDLVGVALRFSSPGPRDDQPPAILVEAAPDGWWYTAGVPDGQLVAVYMTDPEHVRAGRLTTAEGLRAALMHAPLTRARIVGREAPAPPRVASACSQRLDRFVGNGWIAAGDAATAFDPLSSMGIGFALWSGTHAARVAEDTMLGPSAMASAYSETMSRHYEQYLQQRDRYYQLERRWADRRFWAARNGRSAVAVTTP